MAVTYNRYKFVAISLLKRLRNGNGCFASETATWIQKWFKMSTGASSKLLILAQVLILAIRNTALIQYYGILNCAVWYNTYTNTGLYSTVVHKRVPF
jgi:hypothetical protein